jgi:SOS-response transcriptional repressor LexA
MKLGLTKRQVEVLAVIRDLIEEKDYAPTYEEIAARASIKSLGNVKWFVDVLADRGHIIFQRSSRRSIALL